MSSTEQAHDADKYWLGFSLVPGIGTAKLQALLDYYGDVAAAWQATELELKRLGVDKRATQNLLEARAELDLDAKLAEIRQKNIKILHWDSPLYPAYLREVDVPPPVLYMHGRLVEQDQFAVAIVGTRRLTSYGRQMTREITTGLVRHGVTIVSGLAKGIDSIAHQTALDLGGRTVAVLGSGFNHVYPSENRLLARQIVKQDQGAVITEYDIETRPQAKNFPPRNRVISGLSLGTVVIEGGLKSGALITADFALEQNREVFAVPGYVTSPVSAGPNRLIQQGAKLVTCAEDILEELQLMQVVEHTAVQMALPESAEEAAILAHLSTEPKHIDDISRAAEIPSAMASSTLVVLELKGIVQHVGGMKYALFREMSGTYTVTPPSQE